MKRDLFFGPLLALTLINAACSYGKGAVCVVEGRDFPGQKLSLVREGMTADEVRAQLGPPFEIKTKAGVEHWRYYVRQRQDENVYVLGFIRVRNPVFIWSDEAVVEIREGLVDRVEYKYQKELDKVRGKSPKDGG